MTTANRGGYLSKALHTGDPYADIAYFHTAAVDKGLKTTIERPTLDKEPTKPVELLKKEDRILHDRITNLTERLVSLRSLHEDMLVSQNGRISELERKSQKHPYMKWIYQGSFIGAAAVFVDWLARALS